MLAPPAADRQVVSILQRSGRETLKDTWYADNRDLVKWGTLEVLIDPKVWLFFRNPAEVEKLGPLFGQDYIHHDLFDPTSNLIRSARKRGLLLASRMALGRGISTTVTTLVDNPVYFCRPYLTSSDFKKVPDATGWSPSPCSAR